ncbi:thiamine phosphate synthase [Campylobacter iguaniorum]|uniref:Thiamine-phosphate synthase n=1 Tax=Campylobacter iguaniorum TaxID=1244531 RepID=A0A076FCG4_9BACT|nr:thiamine phosphate synthase [Campylobacter iguaniorum]AII15097.1 thiamine phosphate synthase [Campylobacter iguaniorum]
MNQLYILTDSNFTPPSELKNAVQEILNSGIKLIQYRNKSQNHDINLLKWVVSLCDEFGAKLIINDDPILAVNCGAHGVHVGKEDGGVLRAREILGDKAIIGASCYNDINLAIKAQNDGASYVAFGAMFTSQTKPNAKLCDHEIVKKAKEILSIPVCVIGGINSSNLQSVCALKPDYIAIISAAYKPNSITQNIVNLQNIIRK